MELIDAISKILHFQYRFELVPDGKYTRAQQIMFKANALSVMTCRQVRLLQQSNEAVGWIGETFIRSSELLTVVG